MGVGTGMGVALFVGASLTDHGTRPWHPGMWPAFFVGASVTDHGSRPWHPGMWPAFFVGASVTDHGTRPWHPGMWRGFWEGAGVRKTGRARGMREVGGGVGGGQRDRPRLKAVASGMWGGVFVEASVTDHGAWAWEPGWG